MTASRPEWTKNALGIPVDVVVRLRGGPKSARQDIQTSRTRVSLIRPGSLQHRPEDDYEVSYVYGADASNRDLLERSLQPVLRKLLDGYNVAVVLLGATGLEVAKKRRMPDAKSFDFVVESSFVEVYSEECFDLFQKGDAVGVMLPVVEDTQKGYTISGLSSQVAKSPEELRACFNTGRANRDTRMLDIGSVHERATAIFTIHVSQYTPAVVHGEEDRVLVSRVMFVDLPGTERLAMDPEVLQLREGVQINKGLMAFAAALRSLSADPSACFVNYGDSTLTKLLSDALGGNCITTFISTLRQGEYEVSSATLKCATMARYVRNFPIINNNRARGLLNKIRTRMMSMLEDREALREQLEGVPAAGDPDNMALSFAKMRDMQARLLEERQEKAELLQEKDALQSRLASMKAAGTDDVRERSELQEALIASEEARLQVSRTLIDFQLDYNEAKVQFEAEQFALEQRVMELEAARMEQSVGREEHAASLDERDRLNAEVLAGQQAMLRLKDQLKGVQEQYEREATSCAQLRARLAALEAALESAAGMAAPPADYSPDRQQQPRPTYQDVNQGQQVGELKALLLSKERKMQEMQGELAETQRQLDRARTALSTTQVALEETREGFKRRVEGFTRDVAEMAAVASVVRGDPQSGVRIPPEQVCQLLDRLASEVIKVAEGREVEAGREVQEAQSRSRELRGRYRRLAAAYRSLRYKVEEQWGAEGGGGGGLAPSEEEVAGGAMDEYLKADEIEDQKAGVRLRERAAALESQLQQARAAGALRGVLQPSASSAGIGASASSALELENGRLRAELDAMKRRLSASDGDTARALHSLPSHLQQARSSSPASAVDVGEAAGDAEAEALARSDLRKQLKEFTINTQMELERKVHSSEARATMAEEQLEGLQQYLAQASVVYQREIVRLRAVVMHLDASGEALKMQLPPPTHPPAAAAAP